MATNIIHTFYKSTNASSTIELKNMPLNEAEQCARGAGITKGVKYIYSHSNRVHNGRMLADTKLFNGQSVNDMT